MASSTSHVGVANILCVKIMRPIVMRERGRGGGRWANGM